MYPGKTTFLALAGAALLFGPSAASPLVSGLRAAGAELVPSAEPGWPQFRGPRRDGISDERGLRGAWPEGGPRLIWKAGGLGKGFSSPVIAGGRLFITGDFGEEARVLAFDLDGRMLWSVRNGDAWLNQYQGARASVAVRDGRVYHQNAHGRVVCLDAATGAERWAVDLLRVYGGENITWGLSECLLVDDRAVYATAGGRDALLAAFDRLTGQELWRSDPLPVAGAEGGVDHASYASPILVRFAGRRLLIGASLRNLYCADADTGKLQWTRPRPTSYSVLAMMPVLAGDAVFMSAPHGPPGRLHRLIAPRAAGDPVGVEDLWTNPLDPCQGGVVQVGGRLYGAHYPARRGWAALDAATGRTLFEAPDLIKGAPLFADGRIYALSEDGTMLLLEPTDSKFEIRGRFRIPGSRGRDAWAHPVILDGRLYLRYHETLFCHDVQAEK